jgi:hypothetical protein
MSQQNKFDFRITQNNEQWDAEITRRVSARRTTVSKRKKGFASEALATEWAKEALAGFLENQKLSNKRKSEKRASRNELAAQAIAAKEAAAALYQEKQQAYFEALDEEEFNEE